MVCCNKERVIIKPRESNIAVPAGADCVEVRRHGLEVAVFCKFTLGIPKLSLDLALQLNLGLAHPVALVQEVIFVSRLCVKIGRYRIGGRSLGQYLASELP